MARMLVTQSWMVWREQSRIHPRRPEGENTNAVEAVELTERRPGVDVTAGKAAPGATRGEGEIRSGAAEMGAGENIAPPGDVSDRSLIPFFPLSRQIAGISNKKSGSRIRVRFLRDGAPSSRLAKSVPGSILTESTYGITQPIHRPRKSHYQQR